MDKCYAMVKKLHAGEKMGIYGFKIDVEYAIGLDFESMIIFMLKKRLNDINFLNVEPSGGLHKDVVLTDEEKENIYFLFPRGTSLCKT